MARAFFIPNGPKNLASWFPSVDFNEVAEYYLEIRDADAIVVATTTKSQLEGECCTNAIRLHFLNYSGGIDSINTKRYEEIHTVKSESFTKTTPYPLVKTAFSTNRFNVKANDTLILSILEYAEEDMKWVNELIDSPFVLMEWSGEQGQSDSYIPVIVEDMEMQNLKIEDRYLYEIIIKIQLSNEKFIIRN
jgi:hypothetical protein